MKYIEDNEFCEWEVDGVFLICMHKTYIPLVTLKEEKYRYKYCPICEKKIKVVEQWVKTTL